MTDFFRGPNVLILKWDHFNYCRNWVKPISFNKFAGTSNEFRTKSIVLNTLHC